MRFSPKRKEGGCKTESPYWIHQAPFLVFPSPKLQGAIAKGRCMKRLASIVRRKGCARTANHRTRQILTMRRVVNPEFNPTATTKRGRRNRGPLPEITKRSIRLERRFGTCLSHRQMSAIKVSFLPISRRAFQEPLIERGRRHHGRTPRFCSFTRLLIHTCRKGDDNLRVFYIVLELGLEDEAEVRGYQIGRVDKL